MRIDAAPCPLTRPASHRHGTSHATYACPHIFPRASMVRPVNERFSLVSEELGSSVALSWYASEVLRRLLYKLTSCRRLSSARTGGQKAGYSVTTCDSLYYICLYNSFRRRCRRCKCRDFGTILGQAGLDTAAATSDTCARSSDEASRPREL